MRVAIEALNTAFSEKRFSNAARHRSRADELLFIVEDFRCRRPSHANGLLKEDAGRKYIAAEVAAGIRDETIRIAQQGERAVEARYGWNADH
ncbi:hypothetical protein AAFN47_26795 [Hoeflea sp. CAU 1731]